MSGTRVPAEIRWKKGPRRDVPRQGHSGSYFVSPAASNRGSSKTERVVLGTHVAAGAFDATIFGSQGRGSVWIFSGGTDRAQRLTRVSRVGERL